MNSDWHAVLRPMLDEAGMQQSIVAIEPLTGGVSSDIVRVDLADGTRLCAKRALSRLKVASLWGAPVERNHFEVAWLRLAAAVVPGAAPAVLGEDQRNGVALLEFLPPEEYRLWKPELLAGRFDPAIPHAVALVLGKIHAATWSDRKVANDFATDAMFDALRLSPYLRTLAERTPDLAEPILAITEQTAGMHLALVHGDVSPKNILIAKNDMRPVLLDAECAWYGDPAFDAAFFLNHLVLKASHVPSIRTELLNGAADFAATWLSSLPPAARADAERRVAALLPCLMLARVDGKSPVEYLDEDGRARVRALSRPHIASTPTTLATLVADLGDAMQEQDGS